MLFSVKHLKVFTQVSNCMNSNIPCSYFVLFATCYLEKYSKYFFMYSYCKYIIYSNISFLSVFFIIAAHKYNLCNLHETDVASSMSKWLGRWSHLTIMYSYNWSAQVQTPLTLACLFEIAVGNTLYT